jgi:hypothetical protein
MPNSINFTDKNIELLPNAKEGQRSYYLDNSPAGEDIEGFGLAVNEYGRKKFILIKKTWRGQQILKMPCGKFPEVSIDQARQRARAHLEQLKLMPEPNMDETKI